MIYAVRTIGGKEEIVVEQIANKAIANGLQIYSVFKIEEMKGYVFVEGELEDIEIIIKDVSGVRSIIREPIPIEQLEKFLEPKKTEVEIEVGNIVEVVGGPFKGQRGKVTRVDKIKREVTIEILEVAVPIPVTISVDLVKVVKE
ncbi:MAG: transcription elongation factor Spt5 [Candidatus Aenigmarchaeota archaeon]|nr:transcription elongation factor Spt5 [Candidatus Aenigmarchaeota archaeon]